MAEKDSKIQIKPKNPDIDNSRRQQRTSSLMSIRSFGGPKQRAQASGGLGSNRASSLPRMRYQTTNRVASKGRKGV